MGTRYVASTKAAEAPDIEPGLYEALFKGSAPKLVLGGKFGPGDVRNMDGSPFKGVEPKDGQQFNKLEWSFALVDATGAAFVDENDKPIVVTKITGHGFNIAAKTTPGELTILKALLTKDEYAAFEAGSGTDEDKLIDRKVQVEVFVKDNGWPGVGNVIAPAVARVARPKVAARQPVEE